MTDELLAALDADRARYLLKQMIFIRRFEAKAAELYSAQKIRGFLHLYDGEEASGVGAMQAVRDDDAVIATYREHGLALARGLPPGEVMAELYGKQEGSSRGRGGSMHIFDEKFRFYGGNAIVGGHLPVAVGMALADKMQKRDRVTVVFFGEGATNEGEFPESLNLAALWTLPVLFVCENNHYAMGSAEARVEASSDLIAKAEAFGVPGDSVDGMDVLAVEDAVKRALADIRAGEGPAFLESRTYRFRAHSMFDAQLYREKEEVEEWKHRDPIHLFEQRVLEAGLLQAADLEAIRAEVDRDVDAAVDFAEKGTFEPVEDLMKDVLKEPVHKEAAR